jgi:dTDP-4-amino-4,6-dideoxygalactose transaminase
MPDVQAALTAAFASGDWGKYHGEHVCALEDELKATFGVAHAFTCASGTLAVETALRAVGVKPDGEVIQGAYDYESNFLNIVAIGAKPVLVDTLGSNATLDVSQIAAARGTKTQAILATHLHGGMVDIARIRAEHPGVPIVEDAAQAVGGSLMGLPVGQLGDVGVLSFGGSKLLSAGRGGAILTNDATIAQRAKLFLHRGVQQWAAMSELQAAVLRPQLKQLPERTDRRRVNAHWLGQRLVEYGLTAFTNAVACTPGYYKLGFRFHTPKWGLSRNLFCRAMRAEGVAFDPGFPALHRSRAPSRFRAIAPLPHADSWHDECVILHHPVLLGTETTMETVARAVEKVYAQRESLAVFKG